MSPARKLTLVAVGLEPTVFGKLMFACRLNGIDVVPARLEDGIATQPKADIVVVQWSASCAERADLCSTVRSAWPECRVVAAGHLDLRGIMAGALTAGLVDDVLTQPESLDLGGWVRRLSYAVEQKQLVQLLEHESANDTDEPASSHQVVRRAGYLNQVRAEDLLNEIRLMDGVVALSLVDRSTSTIVKEWNLPTLPSIVTAQLETLSAMGSEGDEVVACGANQYYVVRPLPECRSVAACVLFDASATTLGLARTHLLAALQGAGRRSV